MRHEFDKDYWDRHWADDPGGAASLSPHPYLARETTGLVPSTALDAGAGTGSEAIWLAAHGWHVTAVDISAKALARARERTANTPMTGRVRWIEADLTSWEPGRRFGLVTSSYAHPAMPRQAFYRRIAAWVAPGGTLLIVGHLHAHAHADHRPPAEASAAPDASRPKRSTLASSPGPVAEPSSCATSSCAPPGSTDPARRRRRLGSGRRRYPACPESPRL
jgi:SAM-dependent methyltransferase